VANAKRDAERAVILDALRPTKWNPRQASVRLQTDYKSLLYKMKVLSIKKEKCGCRCSDGFHGNRSEFATVVTKRR
jgi:DNA-binding NtrC family response regulator